MEKIIEKLTALAKLQYIDSKLDKILTLRGSLPEEVSLLEFDIQGLEGKRQKVEDDINGLELEISKRKNNIKEFAEAIKRYEEQLNSVKNNREFEALTKEIEYANLEILTSEKRIRQFQEQIENKKLLQADIQKQIDDANLDLNEKKEELEEIVRKTEIQEKELAKESESASVHIERRILNAYYNIRKNMRNGLAVVSTERDACGGCFTIIPPQTHLEIRQKKKVLICENCGRILVDQSFFNELAEADGVTV